MAASLEFVPQSPHLPSDCALPETDGVRESPPQSRQAFTDAFLGPAVGCSGRITRHSERGQLRPRPAGLGTGNAPGSAYRRNTKSIADLSSQAIVNFGMARHWGFRAPSWDLRKSSDVQLLGRDCIRAGGGGPAARAVSPRRGPGVDGERRQFD